MLAVANAEDSRGVRVLIKGMVYSPGDPLLGDIEEAEEKIEKGKLSWHFERFSHHRS
jgi:hypothetical protein